MGRKGKVSRAFANIIAFFTIIVAAIIGAGLGFFLAETKNIINHENFVEFAPALPTRILDINGTLITEFSAEEKRELVTLSELPRHLIHAVLAREDANFYHHKGFSVRGIVRAVYGKLTNTTRGGGSTITQQVAGTLYTNRLEKTFSRKVRELWWAIQMERRYSKNEILEIYLNYMIMGPGTYGVEAASKYFFGHSARDVSLAEAAVLVVQLSAPTRFNPLSNPDEAMRRQRDVLDKMVESGYATKEEADDSYDEYWANYDYTRPVTAAYFHREDKAPWFSEYVRRELDTMMYGSMNYYRDGYTVHTTLDLRHQEMAEALMSEGIERANKQFAGSQARSNTHAERTFIPVVELLSLAFNLTGVHATSAGQNEQKAMSRYTKTINPVVDMAALAFGIPEIKIITESGYENLKTNTEKNMVEGALISIANETGYITAIIGGSKYEASNQLIRATQSSIQPGSAFKPLYYSAAIDSRRLTASSLIYDVPMAFQNEDGTPYVPVNYGGAWNHDVLLYKALALSLNIPSLKVLDTIGFDAAINRSAALLDITKPEQIRRVFPRVYPLALGIVSISPLQLARAFAVFGNQGQAVTPIAIRMVEDRNGKIVLDPERQLRLEQRRAANNQVVSPQNAYVMNRMLEKTLDIGTLRLGSNAGAKFVYKDENGKDFRMPVAGKTGTTQNWADAWAVGYSCYYTTAIWFGFDRAGNSLGLEITGASLSGRIWGDYMREIHQGLPRRDFARPASGVVEVTVCAKSGLLRTPSCNEGAVTLPFLSGTQPGHQCNIHTNTPWTATTAHTNMLGGTYGIDDTLYGSFGNMPTLPDDLLPPTPQSSNTRNPTGNQWLDGDDGFRSAEPNRVPATGVSNPPPTPPATNNTQGDNSGYETAVNGPEIPSYNFMLD